MRITDNIIYSQSLNRLQQQYSDIATASAQVSSGVRNANVSDDPAAAATVMTTDAAMRGVSQYQRNITSAQTGLSGEESTLDQVTDLLNRAKQIAVQEGSDNSAGTSAAAASEVSQLIDQVVSLGNLQIGDQYTFGGTATTTPPFAADGTYNGNNVARQTAVDQGTTITANQTGQALFVDSGVISSLKSLQAALVSGNTATIRGTITGLDTAFDATQTNLASVGARTDQLSATSDLLTARTTSLTATRSDAADIPIEEATLKLAASQNALQAGLLATSRILQTSLVNFLSGGVA